MLSNRTKMPISIIRIQYTKVMEEKEKKSLGHQVFNTPNRTKAKKAIISNY